MPDYTRFAEAANTVLCQETCVNAHLMQLERDAYREGVNLTGCGRNRQETIRSVVVANGVERIRRGEIGYTWNEFTEAVVEESSPQVKSIIISGGWILGKVAVWLFWQVISWVILRIAQYVVQSILDELFLNRVCEPGEPRDRLMAITLDNNPERMIATWETWQ